MDKFPDLNLLAIAQDVKVTAVPMPHKLQGDIVRITASWNGVFTAISDVEFSVMDVNRPKEWKQNKVQLRAAHAVEKVVACVQQCYKDTQKYAMPEGPEIIIANN